MMSNRTIRPSHYWCRERSMSVQYQNIRGLCMTMEMPQVVLLYLKGNCVASTPNTIVVCPGCAGSDYRAVAINC